MNFCTADRTKERVFGVEMSIETFVEIDLKLLFDVEVCVGEFIAVVFEDFSKIVVVDVDLVGDRGVKVGESLVNDGFEINVAGGRSCVGSRMVVVVVTKCLEERAPWLGNRAFGVDYLHL